MYNVLTFSSYLICVLVEYRIKFTFINFLCMLIMKGKRGIVLYVSVSLVVELNFNLDLF